MQILLIQILKNVKKVTEDMIQLLVELYWLVLKLGNGQLLLDIDKSNNIIIKSTFLGAHAFPKEFLQKVHLLLNLTMK